MGDQRMMSFGFSGSPPPFWQIKYDDDDDRFVASLFSYTTLRASVYDNTLSFLLCARACHVILLLQTYFSFIFVTRPRL